MKRSEMLAIVRSHQQELQAMGVQSLDLFGSVARDEARPDSDVDFLAELNRPCGLFKFIGIQHYLQDLLGCKVDFGTRDMLKDAIRDMVLKEVVRVF
jgi:hypothetical protein